MTADIGTPNPHYIPGYTGHCPQYTFRIGDTYGNTTHKLLLDTKVNRSEKMILTDSSSNDFQVERALERNIDIVNGRFREGDPVYKYPSLPGYEGFIPRMAGQFGQRYTVLATEALAEMEQQQMKERAALLNTKRYARLQDNNFSPTDTSDRELVQSEFKLPLLEVRPQACGVLRNLAVDEPVSPPPEPGTVPSPYFMDVLNPDKRFIVGYAGHVPYGYSKYGSGYGPYTNSALCDFTSNYRRRQSSEWAPVSVTKPDPPLLIQPSELYHKHVGMLPNYHGHIPGAVFRFGKTYGNDTRDAKRWLRGDFST